MQSYLHLMNCNVILVQYSFDFSLFLLLSCFYCQTTLSDLIEADQAYRYPYFMHPTNKYISDHNRIVYIYVILHFYTTLSLKSLPSLKQVQFNISNKKLSSVTMFRFWSFVRSSYIFVSIKNPFCYFHQLPLNSLELKIFIIMIL